MTSELELAKPDGSRGQNRPVSGVFWILLLNLGIYVADHILQVTFIYLLDQNVFAWLLIGAICLFTFFLHQW